MSDSKYLNSMGYVVISKLNELEHRYVAKKILNRDLKENEVVHHINGEISNNEITNLCVMDNEQHEYFHSWLIWKKNKSGRYPSIIQQKKALEEEYGGILLEKLSYSEQQSILSEENELTDLDSQETEIFIVRRNKISKKIFVEFNDDTLISPDGREIEFDPERFGDIEEVLVTELTEKQINLYQTKIKDLDLKNDENIRNLALQRKLFDKLCRERRKLAVKANIPSYLIFDDKTLIDMAEIMPTSSSSMLQVKGVGETKLQKYGTHFIALIKKFKSDFGI